MNTFSKHCMTVFILELCNILEETERGKNEINPCLIAYNHSHLKNCALWKCGHPVCECILSPHCTYCAPTQLKHIQKFFCFAGFLTSQEKIKIQIKTIKMTLSKIARKKQRLQRITQAPYLGRGFPSRHSWLVLLVGA